MPSQWRGAAIAAGTADSLSVGGVGGVHSLQYVRVGATA